MPTHPDLLAKLAPAEVERVRDLILRFGQYEAARLLGLHHSQTVLKAGIGLPVHRLSVQTIRERLSALQEA